MPQFLNLFAILHIQTKPFFIIRSFLFAAKQTDCSNSERILSVKEVKSCFNKESWSHCSHSETFSFVIMFLIIPFVVSSSYGYSSYAPISYLECVLTISNLFHINLLCSVWVRSICMPIENDWSYDISKEHAIQWTNDNNCILQDNLGNLEFRFQEDGYLMNRYKLNY